MKNYSHILFDLGGVLIELGGTPIPEDLFPAGKKLTLMKWFNLPIAHQFERGEISSSDFARACIEDFQLTISISEFIDLFRQWPKRVYPGAKDLIMQLSRSYHISVLSNCNEIHWPLMENEFGLLPHFHACFSSHKLGMTKPHTAVFRHVLEAIGAEPADVLFFDDSTGNIEAAREVGMTAVQVQGVDAIKEYIFANSIL